MKLIVKSWAGTGLTYCNQLSIRALLMIPKNLQIKVTLLLILSLIGFISLNKAQDTNEDEPIKINTLLVNIPVIASDKEGRYISGLKKENFSVFQDNEKQQIEFFADEEAPMNVAILIDTSASTHGVLGKIKDAAREFVKIFRPEDKGMIVGFDFDVKVYNELTSDPNELEKAIRRADISSKSGTVMQDAVYEVITKHFVSIKGRKAIIVLTDGVTGGGYVSNEKLLYTLVGSDTLVYTVVFKSPLYNQSLPPFPVYDSKGKRVPPKVLLEIRERKIKEEMKVLEVMADLTAGRFYEKDSTDLKKTFQSIAAELKKQYVIGFYPQELDGGEFPKITVKVDRDDAVIRTKKVFRLKNAN